MKKAILYIMSFFLALPVYADYDVRGGSGGVYEAVNDAQNLIKVYLFNGLSGAEIAYTSDAGGASHQWFRYSTSTRETTPVASEVSGNTSFVRNMEDGFGYYVGTAAGPSVNYVIWVIDYSKYRPAMQSLVVEEDEDFKCETIRLVIDPGAPALNYFHSDGQLRNIPRKFYLEYNYLRWEEEDKLFVEGHYNEELKGFFPDIDAPLINTSFTVRGDQFAEYFGKEEKMTSAEYVATAIDVHTFAYVITEEGEEELDSEQSYQAPLTVRFEAYSNDPPDVMYTWKMFRIDPMTGEREDSETFRYTTKDCEATFNQSGTYEVILEVKVPNNDDMCSYTSDEYEFRIFLEESSLRLPNAFSPGSTFGANDIYKVSYKSLVSFKASIFNRWGNLLYTWTDPDQGWDGRVNGKYVPTGVYFIVVEAKGADGKKYKENSDINILRSRN